MAYDLSTLEIMVIDDSHFTQSLVRDLLKCMDITAVRTYSDPNEALTHARSKPPDVLIVEYMMEDTNGVDFTSVIRSDNNTFLSYLPIIVLTSYTEQYRIEAIRDAGATEIVAKPVSVKMLHRAISEIIDRPRPLIKAPNYFGPDRRRKNRLISHEDRRKQSGKGNKSIAKQAEGLHGKL